MPIGYISYINNISNYGFIDSPDLDIDRIFFHTTNCNISYKNIYKGDKVSFEYDPLVGIDNGAKDITFIKNASLEGLKSDFKNGSSLKGYLKKIDDRYYVKDIDTYILIRLIVAIYEVNLKEVYEDKLNSVIDYKIVTFTSKNKIRAINVNRQFSSESKLLFEGTETVGKVVSLLKGGYQIRVNGNVLGFLPNPLAKKNKPFFSIGEMINVTCIKSVDSTSGIIFDLTENLENKINFRKEQDRLIATLKIGDRFLGKVNCAKVYGLFISFGDGMNGLIHMYEILGDRSKHSKNISKKDFQKTLEEVFPKGIDIDIIIKKIIDNHIFLTWDKTLETNRYLYKDISDKVKDLSVMVNIQSCDL